MQQAQPLAGNLNFTQRNLIRETIKVAVDEIFAANLLNSVALLEECINPVKEFHLDRLINELPAEIIESISRGVNVPFDTREPLRMLRRCIQQRNTNFTRVHLEKLKHYPNTNPFNLHACHCLQIKLAEQQLPEKIIAYLLRIREAYLEMVPFGDYSYGALYSRFEFMIGKVPFNLDKCGGPVKHGDIAEEITSYIRERCEIQEEHLEQQRKLENLLQISRQREQDYEMALTLHNKEYNDLLTKRESQTLEAQQDLKKLENLLNESQKQLAHQQEISMQLESVTKHNNGLLVTVRNLENLLSNEKTKVAELERQRITLKQQIQKYIHYQTNLHATELSSMDPAIEPAPSSYSSTVSPHSIFTQLKINPQLFCNTRGLVLIQALQDPQFITFDHDKKTFQIWDGKKNQCIKQYNHVAIAIQYRELICRIMLTLINKALPENVDKPEKEIMSNACEIIVNWRIVDLNIIKLLVSKLTKNISNIGYIHNKSNPNPYRIALISTLNRMPTMPCITDALLELFNKSIHPEEKYNAAVGLCRHKLIHQEFIHVIISGLANSDYEKRAALKVFNLMDKLPSYALPVLTKLVLDSDEEVRRETIEILVKFKTATRDMLEALAKNLPRRLLEKTSFYEEVDNELFGKKSHFGDKTRIQGVIGDPDENVVDAVEQILLKQLSNIYERIKDQSIAFYELPPILTKLLEQKNIYDAETILFILKFLQGPGRCAEDTLMSCCWTLIPKTKETAKLLILQAKHESVDVRKGVAAFLGNIESPDEHVFNALFKLLADECNDVNSNAAISLKKLKPSCFTLNSHQKEIINALQGNGYICIINTLRLLEEQTEISSDILQSVSKRIKSNHFEVRRISCNILAKHMTSEDLMSQLMKLMSTDNCYTRHSVVMLFGLIKCNESNVIAFYNKSLKDPYEYVRSSAIEALIAIDYFKVSNNTIALCDTLFDPSGRVRAAAFNELLKTKITLDCFSYILTRLGEEKEFIITTELIDFINTILKDYSEIHDLLDGKVHIIENILNNKVNESLHDVQT